MLIDPQTALDEGWLTYLPSLEVSIDKCVQPNAIDFDCITLMELNTESPAFLSERSKVLRTHKEVPLVVTDAGSYWTLKSGCRYDFTSSFHVKLGQGVAAELIIRSTLNRCGVFLTSGLYDSGYEGMVAGVLHVTAGDFNLAPGTRIGQLKLIRSDASGRNYAGGYNHAAGTTWNGHGQHLVS